MSWNIYDPDKKPAYIITVKGKGFTFECKDNREALTTFLVHYTSTQKYIDAGNYIGMFMGVDILSDTALQSDGKTYIEWLNTCHPLDYIQEFVCEVQHMEAEELQFDVKLMCPDCGAELISMRDTVKPGLSKLYQKCSKCGWHNRNDSDDTVLCHDDNAILILRR